ncbi:hypothetical protein D8B26_005363 [Coccidioides posadasii str. Silveira]|uniref:uncharacterized protein n=1 Tax=Coccidioides posadasii (strain RMSCC 757 / Silveira) TaxID=443226 RepID=UPI001BF00B4D|nr:hypothetical protein D8B26_005363 [Coccidioides posadasii str. Silveira]
MSFPKGIMKKERAIYNARQLSGAAIIQTFDYMIREGVDDVTEDGEFHLSRAAISSGSSTRDQAWRDRAFSTLHTWVVDVEYVLHKYWKMKCLTRHRDRPTSLPVRFPAPAKTNHDNPAGCGIAARAPMTFPTTQRQTALMEGTKVGNGETSDLRWSCLRRNRLQPNGNSRRTSHMRSAAAPPPPRGPRHHVQDDTSSIRLHLCWKRNEQRFHPRSPAWGSSVRVSQEAPGKFDPGLPWECKPQGAVHHGRVVHYLLLSWAGDGVDPEHFDIYRDGKRLQKELGQYGVIHGDIRLANVVYNAELGKPMLIDFDQARLNTRARKRKSIAGFSRTKPKRLMQN